MKTNSVVKVFNIIVELNDEYVKYLGDELDNEDIAIAASVSAVDVQSLLPIKEFSEFIDDVEKFLAANNCKIDRSVDSNRKNSLSHYISFHKKSDESSTEIKIIFHLRLSNHSFYDYNKELRQKRYYRKNVTKDLEEQLSKKVLQPKYKNMIVGDKKVKDFSSLLAVTTENIQKWIKRF